MRPRCTWRRDRARSIQKHPCANKRLLGSWSQALLFGVLWEGKGLALGNLSPGVEMRRGMGYPGLYRLPACLSGLV